MFCAQSVFAFFAAGSPSSSATSSSTPSANSSSPPHFFLFAFSPSSSGILLQHVLPILRRHRLSSLLIGDFVRVVFEVLSGFQKGLSCIRVTQLLHHGLNIVKLFAHPSHVHRNHHVFLRYVV